jgi:hypothetical protein
VLGLSTRVRFASARIARRSATVAVRLLQQAPLPHPFCRTRALGREVRPARESLLYLTAINWFGRGRHMTTGFIDASGVDVESRRRSSWIEWAGDPGTNLSRAGAHRVP